MTPMVRTGIALAALLAPCLAQVAKEANKEYQTPEARAKIVKRLEASDRQKNLKLAELVGLLEIRPGSTVADVGAGTGIMLEHLVAAVGPTGRVIAEDIQKEFLARAEEKIKAGGWTNVTMVVGTDRNPNLPQGLDLVFILDAYHHFDYPVEMLGHISRALKPDGRLAITEMYRKRRGAKDEDMSQHVRADKDEIVKEIESNGFQLLSQQDHASNQYLVIFRKK